MTQCEEMAPIPSGTAGIFRILFLAVATELAIQPDACVSPISFGGCDGNLKCLGGLWNGQSTEETQFYELCFGRIDRLKLAQSLVERKQVVSAIVCQAA